MSRPTYTVRLGECLVVSWKKQIVTSKFDLDPHGRMNPIGLDADTPMIVGTQEGAAISKQYESVRVAKGDQGGLPPRFRPEDQAGMDKFLGRVRKPSSTEQVRDLIQNEGLGPLSLAGSVQALLDAGWQRAAAIEWGHQQRAAAIACGQALREPWVTASTALLRGKETA